MVDSENTYSGRVSRLVGWGHWFAFFNIIFAMIIGTRYVSQSPWPETLLGQAYLAISWVGHFGFLVFALYLLVLFPLTFIIPSRKLFRLLTVCFATLGLTALLLDTQTYHSINLHLTPVVWELLFSGEQNPITNNLQPLFILLPLIFLLQLGLSEWVWRKQRKLSHKHIGRPIAALFFISFIASHLSYIWADAYFYHPITSQKANFPLSYPMTAKSFMEKHGLLDREEYEQRLKDNESHFHLVKYPIEPIKFDRRSNKLNILMISVNNLRFDAVNQHYMPHTYQFAQQNQNFTQHYSSSNDASGVFGLFYGLPSSYASAIQSQGTSPILLSVLDQQGYQLGLFSGNNFDDALYRDVLFHNHLIAHHTTEAQTGNDDLAIKDWVNWTQTSSEAPWFSFIELTTVDHLTTHNDAPAERTSISHFKTNYQRSTTNVDDKLAVIYQQLEQQNLLNNTIVIVTSNHGAEFNETKTNSWGAGSNFSRYQLQVPMIIHWPGKLAATYTHQTSHLDLSVTLLQDLLGVSSNPSDFSSGKNLFNESRRKWVFSGDKSELALITPTQTTVMDRFGNYKLYDKNYRRIKGTNPKLTVLMQGLTELQRFYVHHE